ncbi:MAG: ATP-dependent chaperone ClpB [Candidatus Omnitrophica bacterium]|nr:ATP-dependent chaperone ClpB [Candidatus Omnitrophota bacterium]
MNLDKFTIKAQEAIMKAVQLAKDAKHQAILPEHILMSLLDTKGGIVPEVCARLGVNIPTLKEQVREFLHTQAKVSGPQENVYASPQLTAVLNRAQESAREFGDQYVSSEHVLLAMMKEKEGVLAKTLAKQGIFGDDVNNTITQLRGGHKADSQNAEDTYRALEKFTRDLTESARRGKLDPVIGRDEEIRRVIQILSRRTKNNPVLIGEPGVGKTAVVEGLAQRMASGDVPEGLKEKKLLALDLGSLVAGTKFRGEFEERLKGVLKEIEAQEGQIVMFIDELHSLVGAGAAEGAVDAANMLKPALAKGILRCIGATTLDEYRRHIEKDAALERRFQQLLVNEPSVEQTIAILRGLKEKYEVHHGVRFKDSALVAAAVLASRYISSRFMPDKAIDLIDEAASRLRIEIDSKPEEIDKLERKIMELEIQKQALNKEKDAAGRERLKKVEEEIVRLQEELSEEKAHWQKEKDLIVKSQKIKEEIEDLKVDAVEYQKSARLEKVAEIRYGKIPQLNTELEEVNAKLGELQKQRKMLKEEVDEEDIAQIVSKWTGIPVSRLMEEEVQKLIRMEDELRRRVVGQDQALELIAECIRRARSGLAEPNQPLGSFLFLGPTGVGKTETVKALAEFLFNSDQHMVRIDMSEYMEKFSVSRLIGAPPGYVGHEEGGQLTEQVRRKPYSVILFDEIEKAHPDVFNVLLQILDDGRLTDSQGRVVSFKNTVVIMTSNIGSEYFQDPTANFDQVTKQVRQQLRKHFRPEFLNRIEEIIVFQRLELGHIRDIVDIQIDAVRKRLGQKDISLELTSRARDLIAEKGYSPEYGARPLRRTIQKMIVNPLSKKILKNELPEGGTVQADAKGREIVFLPRKKNTADAGAR